MKCLPLPRPWRHSYWFIQWVHSIINDCSCFLDHLGIIEICHSTDVSRQSYPARLISFMICHQVGSKIIKAIKILVEHVLQKVSMLFLLYSLQEIPPWDLNHPKSLKSYFMDGIPASVPWWFAFHTVLQFKARLSDYLSGGLSVLPTSDVKDFLFSSPYFELKKVYAAPCLKKPNPDLCCHIILFHHLKTEIQSFCFVFEVAWWSVVHKPPLLTADTARCFWTSELAAPLSPPLARYLKSLAKAVCPDWDYTVRSPPHHCISLSTFERTRWRLVEGSQLSWITVFCDVLRVAAVAGC